jgi:glyoxylase-like metal-dependent hydrolase (beta-lactamase superfamily II)
MDGQLEDRAIGPVTVLFGEKGGKYPDGNSLLVTGSRERVLIDPALGVVARGAAVPRVDRLLFSHCHEDHIAGSHLFQDVPCHVHEADRPGLDSIDDMMAIYGFPEPMDSTFRKLVVERFHYTPRDDAQSFTDGDVFDLGGVTIRVLHTPGHTRGHSCFVVQWGAGGEDERLLYLGDIELTSFGPYYGDAWSSLESFELSLQSIRDIRCAWYATFHHIGVLDREHYLERLDRFTLKIDEREARLLEYLEAPRTLDNIVEHRFIYRKGDAVGFADAVERRSMSMHLDRLLAQDRVEEVEPGRFAAVPD